MTNAAMVMPRMLMTSDDISTNSYWLGETENKSVVEHKGCRKEPEWREKGKGPIPNGKG